VLRPVALIVASAAIAISGCGGGSAQIAAAPASKAAPYTAIDATSNRVATITPATLARPIARYKRYVRRQLGRMLGDVRRLRAAIAGGDLARARRAWLRADGRYESIGAAYGAFGDLDAAVDGLPGGLQGATASKRFTGLHRIELALWRDGSTREARPYATLLARDVAHMRKRVAKGEIDSLDFGLRAHEILEDALQLALAGVSSPWAGAALTALDANIDGIRVVMKQLGPIAARSNPLTVRTSMRKLGELDRAVARLCRSDRQFPRWSSVGQREREKIDGLTASTAEQLAYIPDLVSTLPPRPALRAVEVKP
jgi:iron uptake system EfeUOB component EfeO/EfeM